MSSPSTPGQNHLSAAADSGQDAASSHTATGEEEGNVREHSRLLTRTPSHKPGHAFEPLIPSPEAAKLLGNIHVKTLQRYARHGMVPGYQIGGHWYFRASELDSWLHSRINSTRQPADRVDFTQEKNP